MNPRSSKPSIDPASLSSLCLGTNGDRRFRRLAWGCSVCALFLVVGSAGLIAHHSNRSTPPVTPPKLTVPVVFDVRKPTRSENAPVRAAVAEPLPPAQVSASQQPVAEIALPGEVVKPVPAGDLLRAVPANTRAAIPAASVEPSAASRYQPDASTPNTPQPAYPSLALRRGYEGRVVVEFTVAASGQITETRLREGSGFAVLDDAALETVRQRWQFPPGTVRHHFVEIVFQLK